MASQGKLRKQVSFLLKAVDRLSKTAEQRQQGLEACCNGTTVKLRPAVRRVLEELDVFLKAEASRIKEEFAKL